nr:hypothetical protein [Tanacetum cinerariifolium]GFA69671.1 hypothetical protein [Tanacetum cinerariifolium]
GEEMVYASSFKEAALEEEKLNRIKVVYDDWGNPCHRDEVANIFVSHFMSFLGTKDVVYEVEDADSLITKRLDADVALDLIKPVDERNQGSTF